MANSLMVRALSGVVLVVVMVWMTAYNAGTFVFLWSLVALLSLAEYFGLLNGYFRGSSVLLGRRLVFYLGGGLYIAGAMGIVMAMDPRMVITLLTVVWLSDTGAYLIGSAIGRHKMAPKISPKKSWEGFAGGVLFGVAVAVVWYALFWRRQFEGGVSLWGAEAYGDHVAQALLWAGFGLVVALAATAGDLIESKFKRWIGVKDSGRIIPGHGGMLDRFDALYLAVPVAWIYILLTGLV